MHHADLDYLTSADYDDGNPNATPTWSYDAAGNRSDASTVDNLNRATVIGGVSRTYDIFGNTLTKASTDSYSWDALNRMTQHVGASTTNYTYRADGMRTKKDGATTDDVYYYDGQMQMEEGETTSSTSKITRFGLGARGIDYIAATTGSGTTVSYPIYDGHGNMVRTLSRNGSGYSVTAERIFGAWGEVRNSGGPSESKGKYCANLGHVQDDESGLIYMRARYYEPSSGRFVSQDKARHGLNYFAYCSNSPTNKYDESGCEDYWLAGMAFAMGGVIWAMISATYFQMGVLSAGELAIGLTPTIVCALFSVYYFAMGLSSDGTLSAGQKGVIGFLSTCGALTVGILMGLSKAFEQLGSLGKAFGGFGLLAAGACAGNIAAISAALLMIDYDTD